MQYSKQASSCLSNIVRVPLNILSEVESLSTPIFISAYSEFHAFLSSK